MSLKHKGATGSDREGKDFRRDRKLIPKQETSIKPLLLLKRPGRCQNWAIGEPIQKKKNKKKKT